VLSLFLVARFAARDRSLGRRARRRAARATSTALVKEPATP
jgi:hypothetical protein